MQPAMTADRTLRRVECAVILITFYLGLVQQNNCPVGFVESGVWKQAGVGLSVCLHSRLHCIT